MTDITQEISAQIERVRIAKLRWAVSDEIHEDARWLAYQSELAELNALYVEMREGEKSVV